MAYALQWIRSLIFNIQIYAMMAVMAVVFFPYALWSRDGALMACHSWCRWVQWTASWMIGLKTEVRGTPPDGPALVAAKHQSFLDIIMIFDAVPMGRFIMKRILLFSPIFGQYAWRIGCVPVDRGKRGAAVAKMVKDVTGGMRRPGQLIIYPQGTRVAPGASRPYKIGTAVLYETMDQTCVPVATNVGLFWPRHGIYRKPGTAVVEFLAPIPPGLPREDFLARIETEIETASNRLMAEAGFNVEARP
jgi:1-acyl-sn-glycerol-3-phosphate acyltransferase